MMPLEPGLFCSTYSRSLGEPLFGTAPRTDTWILLEYPYPYASKAFEESDLPVRIKEHLSRIQKSLANSRLLLIKKENTGLTKKIRFYIAIPNELTPRMYCFDLNSYDELLQIDIAALISRDNTGYEDRRVREHIFLICTNGKRDRCCAKYGMPLYETLSETAPEHTWQCSHVGGHRFAPNLVLLPYGIYYGRIPKEEAMSFFEASQKGRLLTQYYRGRASYTPERQAAEYYLRNRIAYDRVQGIELIRSIAVKENLWQVDFTVDNSSDFQVLVSSELSDYSIIESCSAPEKRTQQWIYHLVDIHGSVISTS